MYLTCSNTGLLQMVTKINKLKVSIRFTESNQMFKMSCFGMDTCMETFVPLINCDIHDTLSQVIDWVHEPKWLQMLQRKCNSGFQTKIVTMMNWSNNQCHNWQMVHHSLSFFSLPLSPSLPLSLCMWVFMLNNILSIRVGACLPTHKHTITHTMTFSLLILCTSSAN